LVRGAAVEAHTDNTTVSAAFGRNGTKAVKGRKEIMHMVDAVKKLVKMEDIELEVKLVEAKNNRLADALSRFSSIASPSFTSDVAWIYETRVEGAKQAKILIERIGKASLISKYCAANTTSKVDLVREADGKPQTPVDTTKATLQTVCPVEEPKTALVKGTLMKDAKELVRTAGEMVNAAKKLIDAAMKLVDAAGQKKAEGQA